jgi:hypothetical protein
MDEQASFEARAVLAPRRARVGRLLLLVPVLALAATAWAGASARSDRSVAEVPQVSAVTELSTEAPESSSGVAPGPRIPSYPAQVLGLQVHRLDEIEAAGLVRDKVIAVSGWYVATAIADCPPLAALFRTAPVPDLAFKTDEWAFCERSGMFFGSGPSLDQRQPTNHVEDDQSMVANHPPVPMTLAIGVVVPPELEMIGAPATPIVVIGRFVDIDDACPLPAGCRAELMVDHLAWTPSL